MEHASTFAAFLNATFSAWAGTAMLWFSLAMVAAACVFLIGGAVDREPEAVKPAGVLVVVAACAFYLAGRLG